MQKTNGGMAELAGAGAAAAGCGMVAGALLIGVLVGVGIYYGVKYLTAD